MFTIKSTTNKLIAINLICYTLTLLLPGLMYTIFALHMFDNDWFNPMQLLTYQFIHDTNPLHIIFNMMILFVFGSAVENRYGSKKMLGFYLVSGLVAGILHNITVTDELRLLSTINRSDLTLVGASGSVWGVFALFTLLFPNEPLYLFFIPIPFKAKWVFTSFFVIELISAFVTNDNISHFAHVGGAITGALFYIIEKNSKN